MQLHPTNSLEYLTNRHVNHLYDDVHIFYIVLWWYCNSLKDFVWDKFSAQQRNPQLFRPQIVIPSIAVQWHKIDFLYRNEDRWCDRKMTGWNLFAVLEDFGTASVLVYMLSVSCSLFIWLMSKSLDYFQGNSFLLAPSPIQPAEVVVDLGCERGFKVS